MRFIPWDSTSINWDDFDAVIIRSTWDYQQKENCSLKLFNQLRLRLQPCIILWIPLSGI